MALDETPHSVALGVHETQPHPRAVALAARQSEQVVAVFREQTSHSGSRRSLETRSSGEDGFAP